jgi:hypothetical protein
VIAVARRFHAGPDADKVFTGENPYGNKFKIMKQKWERASDATAISQSKLDKKRT